MLLNFDYDTILSNINLGYHSTTTIHAAAPPPLALWSFQPIGRHSQSANLLKKIDELSLLEDDWDGYGAAAIGKAVINNTRNIIYSLSGHQLPDVTPTPTGTLLLEWESRAGFAALEVGEKRSSIYIKTRNDTRIKSGPSTNFTNKEFWQYIDSELFDIRPAAPTISRITTKNDVQFAA